MGTSDLAIEPVVAGQHNYICMFYQTNLITTNSSMIGIISIDWYWTFCFYFSNSHCKHKINSVLFKSRLRDLIHLQ